MHGRILKKLREAKNVTQASIARSVGISPAQLARLESNQRGLYLEDFILIAEALGEKPGNLLPNDLGDIGHLKPLIDRIFSQFRLSSFSSSMIRDTRDDPVDPSRGEYTSISAQLADAVQQRIQDFVGPQLIDGANQRHDNHAVADRDDRG